jgi:hypothetical protein
MHTPQTKKAQPLSYAHQRGVKINEKNIKKTHRFVGFKVKFSILLFLYHHREELSRGYF